MHVRVPQIVGWLLLVASGRLLAADDIETHLATNLLPAETAFKEVSAYCQAKAAPMPACENLTDWQALAKRTREQMLDKIIFRGRARTWRNAETKVEWLETIEGGQGYRIRKLRYEALPRFWIPALLYEPEKLSGRVPATLHTNGHDSDGKAAAYKQVRCVNLAKRGMLALNVEFIGMGQLTHPGYAHSSLNQLDLCGASGVAPFYLALQRALDVLLALPNADPQRVAVAGLSGGGWQTILISALDERVTLANPVAGYTSFRDRALYPSDLGDSEQNPTDLALVADYTLLTALRAPRPILLTYNAKDECCFNAAWALPTVMEAARPAYRLFDRETALRSHVNETPGTHNFLRDNREALYRMLGDFFYPGDERFARAEIPCDDELKTAEALRVPLPEPNENLHTLALRMARDLPRRTWRLPDEAPLARARLGELVRAKRYAAVAEQVSEQRVDGVWIRGWRLRMGDAWTVPAVEFEPAEPLAVTVIVADEGRKSLADEVRRRLAAGERVIALDPFDFGESKAFAHIVYPLLVAALGDRPLGIQAAQLGAAVRWAQGRQKRGKTILAAVGPRTTFIAGVASALDEGLERLDLSHPLATLRQMIEDNRAVNEAPELFCFGLLEEFDTATVLWVTNAREVTLRGGGPRVRDTFADLRERLRAVGKSLSMVD